MERITKYDIDFGYYILDTEKYNNWNGSDLIDYIGELEDKLNKYEKIFLELKRVVDNDFN